MQKTREHDKDKEERNCPTGMGQPHIFAQLDEQVHAINEVCISLQVEPELGWRYETGYERL